MSVVADDKALTSGFTLVTGPTDPCQKCPGEERCYLLTVNPKSAYTKGCRNKIARDANTKALAEWRAKKGGKPASKETDPDEELWQGETSFDIDNEYSSYRPEAYCSICGSETKALSIRGTVVQCESCGNTTEADTQQRIDAVLERFNTPSQRETDKPAELTLKEQLDLTADCGQVCDGIDYLIDRLSPDIPLGSSLVQKASRMVYRLELLQREFSSVSRNPTYEGRSKANDVMTVLEAEIVKATEIIGELDNAGRYIRQQKTVIKELPPAPTPEPVERQEPAYFTGPIYKEPEPEPVEEYWPGEQLDDGPHYCQMAGHINWIIATAVMYLGYEIEPGRKSWAEKMVFVCPKHSDIRRILQATRWQHCWNLETLEYE